MKHDFKKEAKEIVGKMTLEEKMGQMRFDAPAIERLGIPAYNWWNEALHGAARCGTATVFTQPIGMAASFDPELLEKVGDAVSTEARAKFNGFRTFGETQVYQGVTICSPNINIFRDPRWGRGHETFGEDPYLTGVMGAAYVRGLQGYDPQFRKADATLKHFAVHSGPENTRHCANVNVSKKDLWETYLAAFAMCIRDAKPAAVMGAYNSVNGTAACASSFLLQECLREKMGFDGYVVSDFGAIADIHENHHQAKTAAESSAMAVKAGCQLNLGAAYRSLKESFDQGLIDEESITKAVEMLFETRCRLGMFADDCPYDKISADEIECMAHRELNRKMTEETVVLLKNDGILPLEAGKKKIAVIGPNADDGTVLLGNYNGTPSRYWTILRGIQELNEDTIYARGANPSEPEEWDPYSWKERRWREALLAARRADVVVMVMGLNPDMEGEENGSGETDKRTLELPQAQLAIFREIMKEGKPTIFINVSGSCVNLTEMDQSCNAVIQCFYPGAEGGHAVADVLFGKVNPSARLPITFYRSADELPAFEDYDMQGRTYRYFRGTPVYPFGHGLSYTTFQYENLQINAEKASYMAEVQVKNTGDRAGTEVVMVYMAPGTPQPGDPIKKLVAFARVPLEAGEAKTAVLPIPDDAFYFYTNDGEKIRRTDIILSVGNLSVKI